MGDGHARTRPARRRATGGHVMSEEVVWLVAHLQTVVAASPAAWVGRGMTLSQLTALPFSAQAPMALTDLAMVLGTGLPDTSAMVDRLIRTGLVCSAPDPQDRRRHRRRHRQTLADGGQRYEPAGPPSPYRSAEGHRTTIRRESNGTCSLSVTRRSFFAAFDREVSRNGQRGRHRAVRGDD
jgi:hypothetical protein